MNSYLYVNANPLGYYDPLGLDAFTSDQGVQDCMYCVFASAGFGHRSIEEGFWLVCSGGSFTCDIWPSTVRQGTTTLTTTSSSPRPPDACAIFHTHPRDKGGEPSSCKGCDTSISISQKLPIYVIHPSGVWKYDPDTGTVSQELKRNWFKAPKKRCKTQKRKPCEGLP